MASPNSIILIIFELNCSVFKYGGFYTGTVKLKVNPFNDPRLTPCFILAYTCCGVSVSVIFYKSAILVTRLSLTDISLDNGPQYAVFNNNYAAIYNDE